MEQHRPQGGLRMVARRSFLAGLGAAGAAMSDTQSAGNSYSNSRKGLLRESTRKEFRELIEGGALKAVIVPTGSTEQHNEHLAMINDTASVTLVAQQAALLVYPQVTVATPVSIGISPHWMDRKGTLSLKKETFLAVVFDICESLRTHGVTRILVLNGARWKRGAAKRERAGVCPQAWHSDRGQLL